VSLPSTLQVRAGTELPVPANPAVTPIYQTAAYEFESWEAARDIFALRKVGNLYSRTANPTVGVLERRIAALDGGVGALATASGQAAVTVALLTLAAPGGHVVASSQLYGGTIDLLTDTFEDLGLEATLVAPDDPDAWRAAVRPSTRAFLVESVGNPTASVPDLQVLADHAHAAGVPLVVDNTIATPALLRPGDFGADVVVYSATKQLGGHGGSLGGLVVDLGSFDYGAEPEKWPQFTRPFRRLGDVVLWEQFGQYSSAFLVHARVKLVHDLGPSLSPFNAQQIAQGIETLSLRVTRQTQTARDLALRLADDPRVHHPAVTGNPSAANAERFLPQGTGGVFAFDLASGEDAIPALVDALRTFSLVANIGDTRSLVIHPATTTHSHLDDDQLAQAGFSRATVRLSIGLEDVEDLAADLEQALTAAVGPAVPTAGTAIPAVPTRPAEPASAIGPHSKEH
jgi:O-acetylhomoserine (thiol)-lyase